MDTVALKSKKILLQKRIMITLCILLAFLMLEFGSMLGATPLIKYFCVLMLFVIAGAFNVLQRLKIDAELTVNCDPYMYLGLYRALYKKPSEKLFLEHVEATAWFYIGEYARSAKLFTALNLKTLNIGDKIRNVETLAEVQFFAGNTHELTNLKNEINALKARKKRSKKIAAKSLVRLEMLIEFSNGNYNEALNLCKKINVTKSDKCGAMRKLYYQAICEYALDDKAAAKSDLQTVSQKSGSLMIKKEADKLLKNLG